MKIVANQTIIVGVPVLGDNKKPVIVEREFGGVKRSVTLTENQTFEAGRIVDLDKSVAQELIDAGIARAADEVIDSEEVV